MTSFNPPSIEQLRAQDHAAFEALSERHYVPIRRYLTRLAGDAEVAAELTQETFLRAYQALPRLADDSDVQGWLYRIATNLAPQHYRHGRLIHWRPLDSSHAVSSPLEEDVARQDLVRRALDQLSLDQRACLLLYSWTGYTCAEIGQLLGRSPEAVRMLLVRARRRFRELYEDRDPGAGPLESGDAPRSGRPQSGHPTLTAPCATQDETLPLYARGDLSRQSFAALTDHLAECQDCRAALRAEQSLTRLIQRSLARSFVVPRVLPFASPPAAWHASTVLVNTRPQTQQGELDGSTQVVGVQVRRQVGKVRAQVEREVVYVGHEVG